MKKHVLVCVTGQKNCLRLIETGAEYARELDAQLTVLHVARRGNDMLGNPSEAEALEFLFQASSRNEGDMMVIRADDVLSTIEKQARELGAVRIIAGRARDYHGWDMLDELQLKLAGTPVEIVYT